MMVFFTTPSSESELLKGSKDIETKHARAGPIDTAQDSFRHIQGTPGHPRQTLLKSPQSFLKVRAGS